MRTFTALSPQKAAPEKTRQELWAEVQRERVQREVDRTDTLLVQISIISITLCEIIKAEFFANYSLCCKACQFLLMGHIHLGN